MSQHPNRLRHQWPAERVSSSGAEAPPDFSQPPSLCLSRHRSDVYIQPRVSYEDHLEAYRRHHAAAIGKPPSTQQKQTAVSQRPAREDSCVQGSALVPGIDLTEEELIQIKTKPLNERVKAKGLSKNAIVKVKLLRRTLKNRGYAATCKVKKEAEMEDLLCKIKEWEEASKKSRQEADLLMNELIYGEDIPEAARREALALLNET